jgi:hypothetical protein
MSLGLAALLSLCLIAVLFAVAALVEAGMARQMPARASGSRLRHRVYTLGLGVYCSSWTFYGAAGSAVREGGITFRSIWRPACSCCSRPAFSRNSVMPSTRKRRRRFPTSSPPVSGTIRAWRGWSR